jgi:L-asparagine transporter-like permease
MNYIFGYIITGLLITMFFEFIFQLVYKEGDETKFDSYLERLISLLFWPFLIYIFIERFFKNNNSSK